MTLAWGDACLAPAKINEFLHITQRLDNGYHQLQTVFRRIDFCDVLRFYSRDDNQIRLISEHDGIDATNDLATKAARLLQQYTNTYHGVDIAIEKHIPLGSGLGGGSSNAATTLMALNALWETGLDQQTLQHLGLQIGADVPFFIFGHDAFGQGVGEQLTALELAQSTYLLLFPPVSVSTKAVFSKLDDQDFAQPILPQDYQTGFGRNSLTPAAVDLFPVIGDYLNWLSQYTDARMSGSGATVFGRFESSLHAKKVFDQRPETFDGIIASSLPSHPLFSLL